MIICFIWNLSSLNDKPYCLSKKKKKKKKKNISEYIYERKLMKSVWNIIFSNFNHSFCYIKTTASH